MFRWREYNPHAKGLRTVLSPLESEVMKIMWGRKRATARTVYTILKTKLRTSRPSVNATLNSLSKRGFLVSEVSSGKGGLKYVYRPTVSRSEFEREVVTGVLNSLLESFGKTAKKIMKEKSRKG